jgi:hypothetical protein
LETEDVPAEMELKSGIAGARIVADPPSKSPLFHKKKVKTPYCHTS